MHSKPHYFPLAIWLALLVTATLSLREVDVSQDITQFMPAGSTERQKLVVDLLREGPTTRLIMLALEGGTIGQLANTSRRLARLLSNNNLFAHVANGDPTIQASKLRKLFTYRYLLAPQTNERLFTAAGIRRALLDRLDELNGAVPISSPAHLARDPTGAFNNLLKSWTPTHQPALKQGVWFSSNRERALLLVSTTGSGFDPLVQQQAIASIHTAFADARTTPEIRLKLSGAPIFADTTRRLIRSQVTTLSTIAGILVTLILVLAYRSSFLVLLGALPLLTAILIGAAAVTLLFGNLHGITLVFGVTLLGIAIDYPIHLFSHLPIAPNSRSAVQHIWPTLRLGVITTCIGYLAFARSDFIGLSQLGVFTTTGLISAAALTRWILPLLIRQQPQRQPGIVFREIAARIISMPPKPSSIIYLIVALIIAVLLILSPPKWATDLQSLSPLPAEQRRLANELRNQLGAPEVSKIIVIHRDTPNLVLRSSERLADRLRDSVALGLIKSFDMPSRYLPSSETQKQRQAVLPDRVSLEQQLRQAMQGLPFRANAFSPFLDAINVSRSLPVLDLSAALKTPIGTRTQSLLYKVDHGWNGLITLIGMESTANFERWWRKNRTTNSEYLNLEQEAANLVAKFRESTFDRLLLGVFAITCLISFGLRSPLMALKVLLPIFLAIGLSVALLSSMGKQLSLFHLIALLLTAGIGIDYSLFFQRGESDPNHRLATLHALTICALSTFTVFAILATSPIPVLHAIGLTVAIGVPLCFMLALISSPLAHNVPDA